MVTLESLDWCPCLVPHGKSPIAATPAIQSWTWAYGVWILAPHHYWLSVGMWRGRCAQPLPFKQVQASAFFSLAAQAWLNDGCFTHHPCLLLEKKWKESGAAVAKKHYISVLGLLKSCLPCSCKQRLKKGAAFFCVVSGPLRLKWPKEDQYSGIQLAN